MEAFYTLVSENEPMKLFKRLFANEINVISIYKNCASKEFVNSTQTQDSI